MARTLKSIKPIISNDPEQILNAVQNIYQEQTQFLQKSFEEYCKNPDKFKSVRGFYPYARVVTKYARRSDSRFSYGFVPRPGTYTSTLTRPDLFASYYLEQFRLLIKNHNVDVEIGVSDMPIPLHFALGEDFHLEQDLSEEQVEALPDYFDVPDLKVIDDRVGNGEAKRSSVPEDYPLSLFTAPRVDLSLQRLRHYSGTNPAHFQNFVLFTNYQFYIDEFVTMCEQMMLETDDPELREKRKRYTAFVQPGDRVMLNQNIKNHNEIAAAGAELARLPQMPAYHLKRADGSGITMINIGVGPSNAKTITDHVAVLRPHAWLMLGHCAGLRNSQRLGDYALANGYLREDKILDDAVPLHIPVPALAEIQQALAKAAEDVTGEAGFDIKNIMRTGTVATVADRNWEMHKHPEDTETLSQARAIALDMESATIATNGFRFRVPYGTLLCISDKPLHGQLKLPGMADSFYRKRVKQHLEIGLRAMEHLREFPVEQLHSRKLRSFDEPAFQ